ncbi:hypothetical protein FIBSPDRAFT_1042628 [Athelia psychrophila]|uniref:C2H2-type domain-containing protein n=1 Tax=Athelia psychrophila TaxID=1759441 RepID=A0A166M9L0_9AGAM|nr:hypothetical protein FIBSPDRAFT_1042628 [Fibularhizoctonia sp. CBS 109695]
MDDFDYYLSQPMMDTHMPVPVCLDHNSLDLYSTIAAAYDAEQLNLFGKGMEHEFRYDCNNSAHLLPAPTQREFEERLGEICVDPRELSNSPPTSYIHVEHPLPVMQATSFKVDTGLPLPRELEISGHGYATMTTASPSSNPSDTTLYINDDSQEALKMSPSPSPPPASYSCIPAKLSRTSPLPSSSQPDDCDSSDDAEGETVNGSDDEGDEYVEVEAPTMLLRSRALRYSRRDAQSLKLLPLPPTSSQSASRARPTKSKGTKKGKAKEWLCPFDGCAKSCAVKGDLGRHLQSVDHAEKQFKCNPCGKTFTRPDSLNRHQLGRCKA